MFLDLDKKRQAEQELSQLKQKGVARTYAAEFQRIVARLNCTEDTKIHIFYQGLKDIVKDEIAVRDMPNDFLEYVEMAICIDTRQYKRRQEKQSVGGYKL